MAEQHSDPGSPGRRLDQVIASFQEAEAAGRAPDRRELLARHPELAPELERFFADHDRASRRAGPEDQLTAPYPPGRTATFVPREQGDGPAPGQATVSPDGSPAVPPPGMRVQDVGDHELLEELGRGGMGVVYKARQLKLDRLVALKMILAGTYAGPQELGRFRSEAQAVARLQHPNIVQVYEVGEHEGRPFFSMEFCPGGSLDRKLQGTPLPPREAARLAEILARAVHAAHRQQVVHRDLKPANVLLAADGTPKITDFGLAKRLDDAGQTPSGAVMGTPSYMAPEQAGGQSRATGPAADIYALGAVLYELLTGRPPFRAATPLDTVLQVVRDEPVPPARLQSQTPRDLETICLKCLHKDPRRRYPSALELAEDLRRFQAGEPVRARPVGRAERALKWVRRHPATAALAMVCVLAAAALLAGGVWFTVRLRGERDRAEQARREAEAQLLRAETARYAIQIGLAQRDWREDNVIRAEQVLSECRSDLRGWEHRYLQALCRRRLRTLQGHTAAVQGVAFSPDGQRMATASWDQTVRLWDAATGRETHILRGHTDYVWAVAFSPDGQHLASASRDRTVRVWDTRTGRTALTLRGHKGYIWAVAFSPDGRRLASGSADEMVRIWDTGTGREMFSFRHAGGVNGVAFSPDGTLLATAGSDQTVRVWDAGTGRPVLSLKGDGGAVQGVAFSPDGRRLAAVWMVGTVKVWDARTGAEGLTFRAHSYTAQGLAFSRDGKRLATASADETVRVWDAGTGRAILSFREEAPVSGVAFSPDGRHLASASLDRTAKVWNLAAIPEASALRGHTKPVTSVVFSPDGQRLATASQDETVRVWDAATGQQVLSLGGPSNGCYSVVFSPNGRLLAGATYNQMAKVWDALTGREVFSLPLPYVGSGSVAFTIDGRHLITALRERAVRDRAVEVWDLATGEEVWHYPQPVSSIAVSPDGRRLAGHQMFGVTVWDVATGADVLTLQGHSGLVNCEVFSPDGRLLATASQDQTVRVWDAATGAEVLCLRGHTDSVQSVAFSPDGRRLASASGDPLHVDIGRSVEVKVWDVATGQEVLTLGRPRDVFLSVAFSPDGRRLAGGSYGGTVKVWDAPATDNDSPTAGAGPGR